MRKKNRTLLESFSSAWQGIGHAMRERNFVIELSIGIVAVALSFLVEIPRIEKIAVIILTAIVLGAELANTAIEKLSNIVIDEPSPEVAKIKELMAAAVLIFTVASVIIGLLIFGHAMFF